MTPTRKLALFCVLWLLMLPLAGFGQQDGQFIEQNRNRNIPFTVVRYGTKHGLPQNQVLDIVARKNGNIILSTANGIVEYNGTTFSEFNPGKDEQKNFQTRLFWDEETQQLFGLELSIRFNTIYPKYRILEDFYMVEVDGPWIIGIDTKGQIKKGTVRNKVFTDVYKTTIGNAISLQTISGGYLISDYKKLYYIDTATHEQKIIVEEPIKQFTRNPYSNKLYALGTKHLYEVISPTELKEVPLNLQLGPLAPGDTHLTDMAFIDADTYFVSSHLGLLFIDGEKITLYDKSDQLPSEHFESLYYNKEEACLFVGTGEKGLLKLEMKSCISISDSPGIGDMSLTSVISDGKDHILTIGSGGTIYSIDREGKASLYFRTDSLLSALSMIDDLLYAGTWGGGINLIKNGKTIGVIAPPQLTHGSVHATFRDSRGVIWIGNDKGISKGTSPGTIRPHLVKEISECIVSIYERRDGTICIGGSASVFILSKAGKLIRRISTEDGLFCKNVRAFYEDKEGKLWIGTYSGGIYCYYNEKLTSINSKTNCQLYQDAFTLAPDNKGFIYITSNNGLWAVEESKLNDFYYDRIPYLVPFYYGEYSGILNTEFNGGFQNNFVRSASGDFFFPSIQGMIQKKQGNPKFRKLQISFSSLSVNDTLTSLSRHVFERSTHTLQFEFFSTNYSAKFNVFYQYKLIGPGLPDEWSRMQKNGSISFKMLPPGNYKLSIRAIDGFNDNEPVIKSYYFEIRPYFYETSWFRVLMIILFILGVVAVSRYRYFKVRQKEVRENKIANTILELKLKAIQSKMNPHFIFNALNNIIYLLNAEKYQDAEDLLQDFSLLLRRFLEKSDSTFLTLQEELAIIDLYLKIEQKRYNQQFSYEIVLPEQLSKREIPTLLIQPFVENAVKHGISHIDRNGFIKIAVRETKKGIEISIEDNGIGRDRSAIINSNRINHSSKGIELVKEKISIMQQKYGMDIRLEVIDLSEGSGTLIRLKIPFE